MRVAPCSCMARSTASNALTGAVGIVLGIRESIPVARTAKMTVTCSTDAISAKLKRYPNGYPGDAAPPPTRTVLEPLSDASSSSSDKEQRIPATSREHLETNIVTSLHNLIVDSPSEQSHP